MAEEEHAPSSVNVIVGDADDPIAIPAPVETTSRYSALLIPILMLAVFGLLVFGLSLLDTGVAPVAFDEPSSGTVAIPAVDEVESSTASEPSPAPSTSLPSTVLRPQEPVVLQGPADFIDIANRGEVLFGVTARSTIHYSTFGVEWLQLEAELPAGTPLALDVAENFLILAVDEAASPATGAETFPEFRITLWISSDGFEWGPVGELSDNGPAFIEGNGTIVSVELSEYGALVTTIGERTNDSLLAQMIGEPLLPAGFDALDVCDATGAGDGSVTLVNCGGEELLTLTDDDIRARYGRQIPDLDRCLRRLIQIDHRSVVHEYLSFSGWDLTRFEPVNPLVASLIVEGFVVAHSSLLPSVCREGPSVDVPVETKLWNGTLSRSLELLLVPRDEYASIDPLAIAETSSGKLVLVGAHEIRHTSSLDLPVRWNSSGEKFDQPLSLSWNNDVFMTVHPRELTFGSIIDEWRYTAPLTTSINAPVILYADESIAIVRSERSQGETYVLHLG